MRTAYCQELHELMKEDERIFALTADIGFRNFDQIIADFPERFVNVGVAEADMMGIAAGLALTGKIPFTFTIAPFVTMRCLEQIRVDLCYQKLPVKIIGAGGGFVYGPQGVTHHAIEEVGILRTLPEMTVICPADPEETKRAVRATMELDGPAYIRIGRNREPSVYADKHEFKIGKAIEMRKGRDITIFAYGLVVYNALKAAQVLSNTGIETQIINMHTIKPLDKAVILQCAKDKRAIITVEEHNIIGGLGSAVAEVLAEENFHSVTFKRLGLKDTFCRLHAEHADLQNEYGLDAEGIIKEVRSIIRQKGI